MTRSLLRSLFALFLLGLCMASFSIPDVVYAQEEAATEKPEEEVYSNTLRWTTSSEEENFGFDVYRGDHEEGPFDRLNEEPLLGSGTTDAETSYVFVDDTIDPYAVYWYYIESISLTGERERFTPIFPSKPKLTREDAAGEAKEETKEEDAGEPDGEVDLVVFNGRVYTLAWGEPGPDGKPAEDAPYTAEGWHPDAEAVAIRDGEIVAVGTNEEIRAHAGEKTRVLDAAGATVLPGLVDSHTHVAGLGVLAVQVNLIGVETEEEAVALVAERARTTPKGEWILGRGWDEGAWANHYPTVELLSKAVPDHPVLLDSLHGFAVWGNRLAFEKAGIGKETKDPDGGEILRDANGDPSGVVLNRAGPLLRAAVPDPTPEQVRAHVLAGLQQMARDGYVAVHEAGVPTSLMNALQSLKESGDMPIRVYAMLSAREEKICREWLRRGIDPGVEGGNEGPTLAVRSVKAYYDGALGSRGARLLEDYSDMPGHRGTSGGEYGFDEALVADMMRGGFQVGIHAIGDAGNRETLDFLAGVIEETPEAIEARHRIEHAQVVHPEDFSRFVDLQVVASMEPPHAVEDMPWAEDRVGSERIQGAYAWRTLRKLGVALTFNSDLSGSDHDIFYGLHAAITRRNKEKTPTQGWYPEQNMTPEEALRGYTSWSAYAAHWEDHTGILAPGQWADITLMNIDPLVLGEKDPGAILDGEIVATIVAGEIVYERSDN